MKYYFYARRDNKQTALVVSEDGTIAYTTGHLLSATFWKSSDDALTDIIAYDEDGILNEWDYTLQVAEITYADYHMEWEK